MHKHYIILSSSYSLGKRIALDYIDITVAQVQAIKELLQKLNVNVATILQYLYTVLSQTKKHGVVLLSQMPFLKMLN